MPFDAIVHAPALRVGARVNIAEADQDEDTRSPGRLAIGDHVRLRMGCCSPSHALGRIVGLCAQSETVVLAVDADAWTLNRDRGPGVSTPGLVSEVWTVVSHGPTSPTDHSPAYSTGAQASEG